ncbi:hypothetical protein ASE12_11085 [Aeromicrobium sp. Root236]|uniref:hypothetical protein n=1 Tax=Aeromicrobium sp. Root236 TaxID=1736498 RepID=UPI0006F436C9|nr:hypothetical protein [Aeromicrobium sp. Root236]KRC65258.1 hypothetical protein ASE12_11085 [Aeromicrobium sp. Root236]
MLKTLAALTSVAALTSLAGCGNAVDAEPPAGLAGISVTAGGHLVIDVFVCRDKVDKIEIARDREGLKETEENPVVRTYTFERPMTGHITLDLARPAAGWSPQAPTTFEAGKGYIVTGESSKGYDSETFQVNVEGDGVDALKPGAVYTSDDDTTKLTAHTPAEFEKNAKKVCA